MEKIKITFGGQIVEVEKTAVSEALEAGELKIETDKEFIVKTDDIITYSKEDFETFKTNHGNAEYKKGKIAGYEMLVKEAKEKEGIEVDGKNFDVFSSELKKKVLADAKIEPTKKIMELENDLKTVRTNYTNLEGEFNTFKEGQLEKETRLKKDNILSGFIPSEGLKVGSDITLMALKTKAGIDINFTDDNKSVITVNGEVVKNPTTLEPVDSKDFIANKLKEMDLISKPNGGAGGSDETGQAKAGSWDSFVIEMKNNDIEQGTDKFSEEMDKRIKDKTLVM